MRESNAALSATMWMGSTRRKTPKQIEESLIKLLDDVHLSGWEAGIEHAQAESVATLARLRRCAECGCCADNYKCPANKEVGKR